MNDILHRIVQTKIEEVAQAKRATPIEQLEVGLDSAPPVRSFRKAISRSNAIQLIAEVKHKSPSKGVIRADFDPVKLALEYVRGGAACLSVLTDVQYFGGSLEYLRSIRAAVDVPLLRKEFVIDRYQVVEARVAGADAVLLIAECLPGDSLLDLLHAVTALGMDALVEVHDEDQLERVLHLDAPIIGINNRDLRTFEVDLDHCVRLSQRIPAERIVVGESGIFTRQDALKLQSHSIHAMLVGESLMRQPDLYEATKALLG